MSEGGPDPWRRRFHSEVRKRVGLGTADRVAPLDDDEHDIEDNVAWTARAIGRLQEELDQGSCIQVLNACAHVLPDERIEELREIFQSSKDLAKVHSLWQRRYIENLERRLGKLPDEWLNTIKDNGWGEAGRLEGKVIIATKVPKDLPGWFNAESDEERRYCYCHCDRIREVFLMKDGQIPSVYCNCGGGFYRSNWERVLGHPVWVELRSSILRGDADCSFIIHLDETKASKD